jgi:hypothetical protein
VAPFRCECGLFGCARLVELKVLEYELIRTHPRRFLVAVDHDLPEAEIVVERNTSYLVIEKQGQAGEWAEAADPRR